MNRADTAGLGIGLLELRDCMYSTQDNVTDNNTLCSTVVFASETLSSVKYSEKEWEVFWILHGLENFMYHYCFAKAVYVIMDHKPLVGICKKNIATQSQICSASCYNYMIIKYT